MKRPLKQTNLAGQGNTRQSGFTLVEVLVSLLIMGVLTGAVFEQINRMQKRSSSEAMKLDQTQQARDFLDQTVRDLHMSGYPSASMYTNPPVASSPLVAVGLVSVSPTQLVFEGDVNNDGNVYRVNISYVAADPNDPSCPCVRRTSVTKLAADSLNQPLSQLNLNYTEATNVLPPGAGVGESGEDLFTYYDQGGTVLDPADPNNMAKIKTIKVSLSLLSKRDFETGGVDNTAMSATVRLN
jgi:prepilin-type N-terminal cleavage/methylation domain-containing protein